MPFPPSSSPTAGRWCQVAHGGHSAPSTRAWLKSGVSVTPLGSSAPRPPLPEGAWPAAPDVWHILGVRDWVFPESFAVLPHCRLPGSGKWV